MPSTIAPSTNSTAQTVVARDSTVAPARAERRLARTAAERVGDVAALSLLQEDDHHQHEADDHVHGENEVIQHIDREPASSRFARKRDREPAVKSVCQ